MPDVLKSDTNRAVFENLFNRFLTKSESKFVAGYVGEGNPEAIVSRQIQEPTLHRQAHQLQPIIYNKIGSVEHMASWKNILVELDRLGVDVERLAEWGAVQTFNWVPPVDIDKLIHFEDYYWYDPENPTSTPQYITMRSRCTTAIANANMWEGLVDEYGESIPLFDIDVVDDTLPTYSVVSITAGTDAIVVSGDITSTLHLDEFFTISNTASNNGEYRVTSTPTFDNSVNESTFTVTTGTLTVNETVGTVNLRRFDKLILDGEYIRLYDPGFVFLFRNSTNVDLNNFFLEVLDSDYDETTNRTTIQLTSYFTDNTVDGVLSIREQLEFYQAERTCQCSGGAAGGWDSQHWDDNPSDPVWGDDLDENLDPNPDGISDLTNLMDLISVAGPPVIDGGTQLNDLWYDTVADILYLFDGTSWKLIYNTFSLILDNTEGFALWDSTEECDADARRVHSSDQWTTVNMWLHKSDVPNFAVAKQAAYPIIEYDWDLELNEWTYTTYNWKYREDKFVIFESSDISPAMIELQELSFWEWATPGDPPNSEIVLDDRYGDLTDYFVPGKLVQATGTIEVYEVDYSSYVADSDGLPYKTRIKFIANTNLLPGSVAGSPNGLVASPTPLYPYRTAFDDPWKAYGEHWLFDGANNALPTAHQPDNPFILTEDGTLPITDPSGDYSSLITYYSQTFIMLTEVAGSPAANTLILDNNLLSGTTRTLQERALIGNNDVRVYINDIRQYGNYDEIEAVVGSPLSVTGFVAGITFLPGHGPEKFDEVRVEVGEPSIKEFGAYSVPVRVDEEDADFVTNGNRLVSLIECRRAEQVKTEANQYPLFDIYNIDGTPAFEVSPIFGYLTSEEADVNPLVRLRTVYDADSRVYSFDQFLINEDDGVLKAYRDYANLGLDIWYNPQTQELKFFDNLSWSLYTDMDNHYRQAIISDIEPDDREKLIDGLYWVDTLNGIVFQRNTGTALWDVVTEVDTRKSDSTLQTIWKKGLNDEKYIPEKVDWDGRSEAEYIEERDLFVEELAEELILADSSLTESQAILQATTVWLTDQANPLSTSGMWVGDWEVPDPLYFNHLNENRKILTSSELLTHFNTIINEQPKIPGYNGERDSMFHLIATNDVNYGLGGTIKEFNDSYDTALSAVFINNVTVPTLIEFAHDQYESMLSQLEELYTRSAVDDYTNVTQEYIIDFANTVSSQTIDAYELNDIAGIIYGDSTTFTDVDGVNDIGIKNWIATLPYLKLLFAVHPEKLSDSDLDFTQILHHDGHRNQYELEDAVRESLIAQIIDTPDDRTRFPGPSDPPQDTFGRQSNTDLPPNDITEFSAEFNTTILNRNGVYWYYTPDTRTFYRLITAAIGDQEPSSSLDDGTLWLDMTIGGEVLRVKETSDTGTVQWNPAQGNTIGDGRLHNGTDPSDLTTAIVSAWQPISLDEVLGDIVLDVETRLYENVPVTNELRYDFEQLQTDYPTQYDVALRVAFLDYVSQKEIVGPFLNTDYDATDPFTWNYKYSTPGVGYSIVETDDIAKSISIQGSHVSVFNIIALPFFVKNSNGNDGTWTTLSVVPTAVYDAGNDVTIIYVTEDVVLDNFGIVYTGVLPSSLNDGSESGGEWKDLYEKLYGTPFPHLEPWKLQGYISQPTWWDDEYLNDDTAKWGNRTWKYKHGFDIVFANTTAQSLSVDGDFRETFIPGLAFSVDGSTDNDGTHTVTTILPIADTNTGTAGTATLEFDTDVTSTMFPGMNFSVNKTTGDHIVNLTVVSSVYAGPPSLRTIVTVEETVDSAIYFDFVGGATYNPSTNETEILLAPTASPPTGTVNTSIADGRIVLALGMWEQIQLGYIKAGERYPNNVLSITGIPLTDIGLGIPDPTMPTYNYFSVNIDNGNVSADGGTTVYGPDDIFPPYWDYTGHYGTPITFDEPVRSIFSVFGVEIVTPSADYVFGDAGPVEYEWRTSSQFLYDQLTVAFKLDPIRMITHTFGIDFLEIANLQIDSRTERVLSHNRTDFHGEIIDNVVLKVDGSNQWYVNYNRFTGFDLSLADFRSMWTGWTAPMTYQFASFVDTASLSVGHRVVPISNFDYEVTSKRSPAVEDFWNDAFKVSVTNIPPHTARYDNQGEWRFELRTNLNVSRTIEYYDVHNYQFNADLSTNICTLYNWTIRDANFFTSTFKIDSNQTTLFTAGKTFIVDNSTSNNGTYTVESAVYDSATDLTIITVIEQLSDLIGDGDITLDYRTLPWVTGDSVYLSTAELLPYPLRTDDTVNGLYKYFIHVIDDTTFKLALTQQEAVDGATVDITAVGRGDSFVGEVRGTFVALEGHRTPTLWRRYTQDKTNVLTISTPHAVSGVQDMINIVLGYDAKNFDDGWRINDDRSQFDPSTGRVVDWQLELERFIDYAYSLRVSREQISNRYRVSADAATDIFTFLETNTHFITGDAVTLLSSNNVTPTPIVHGLRYYMIRDSLDEFRLAGTKFDAQSGIAIDITSATGIGDLVITNAKAIGLIAPTFEMNPARNAIWFRPTRGIVSDLIAGPTEDIRSEQLMFDQYGRRITVDQLHVFREDKQTQITIADELKNDIEPGTDTLNPYHYIHLGGAHLFVDTHEHVLKFNNYTTDDLLLYDPFIGLNITKIELNFERQVEFTQRPNMGGYYLETFFNQNADLNRNIEASIEDLRHAYDTYVIPENNIFAEHSRKSLGYEGTKTYLDDLNLNDKSQFAFWRGQIQHKGALNAIDAFINSRRFIDAKVDEFWAYKIAEFGSSNEKEYPEMYITSEDARSNDFRVEFVTAENPIPDDTFTAIQVTDEDRWYNQPDQIETLRDNGQHMYFDMKLCSTVTMGGPTGLTTDLYRHDLKGDLVTITVNRENENDYLVYNPDDNRTLADTGQWLTTWDLSVKVILFPNSSLLNNAGPQTDDDFIVDANHLTIWLDGVELVPGLDYGEVEAATPGSPSLSQGTSSAIELKKHVVFDGTQYIEALIKPVTLIPDVHFEYVNSNIVRLMYTEIIDSTLTTDITIWSYVLDENSQNPARLVDRETDTLITPIQVWDPARNHNYYNSEHNINLWNVNDPAYYNNDVNATPVRSDSVDWDNTYHWGNPNPWGVNEVGTTWIDSLELDYVPYYDTYAFPDTESRLRLWGQRAPWASGTIYEWVKSDVPPEEWDALASVEEGDSTIVESERKSGVAKYTLFENTSIIPGSPTWFPLRNKNQEFDAAIEGVDNLDGTYTFTITNSDLLPTGSPNSTLFDVYVNGILVEEQTTNTTIEAKEADRVRFVLPVPNQTTIDAANDAANAANDEAGTPVVPVPYLQSYQYTTDVQHDDLQAPFTTYYFWVEQKNTRPSGSTRTMSAKDAQVDMVNIPVPYAVMQKPELNTGITVEADKQISRVELRTYYEGEVVVGGLEFATGLSIAPNTEVLVSIDGVPVDDSYVSFTENTTSVIVTDPVLSAGSPLPELIEITYTGLYDSVADVPTRFIQVILRGLRGLVDADRRYTIRFTRDFTLRDSLEKCLNPLNLKNLHEEWKMFRQEQQFHVDRYLWDKITESMVGYKLNDPSIRVPSLDRQLYDARFLTETQYGLGNGQTFTDGQLAIQTVLADLQNPDHSFQPVDINVFFELHNFDSNEEIIDSMDTIYNTFPHEHVNRIYFSVLLDALSLKSKYSDIFKTSMIALHGIRPFQIAGIFDD